MPIILASRKAIQMPWTRSGSRRHFPNDSTTYDLRQKFRAMLSLFSAYFCLKNGFCQFSDFSRKGSSKVLKMYFSTFATRVCSVLKMVTEKV